MFVLVEDQRSWADEAHLTLHDVDQLWQLVQRIATQEPPDPGDPWIVRNLEHARVATILCVLVQVRVLALVLIGIGSHRPELVDAKQMLSVAHSHLPEEDWAR